MTTTDPPCLDLTIDQITSSGRHVFASGMELVAEVEDLAPEVLTELLLTRRHVRFEGHTGPVLRFERLPETPLCASRIRLNAWISPPQAPTPPGPVN